MALRFVLRPFTLRNPRTLPGRKLSEFENFGRFWLCPAKKWVNPNNTVTNAHSEPKLPTVEHFKPLSALNCWVLFSCRGAREISWKKCKEVCEVYISPYCRQVLVPPTFMKFGIRGQLTDVITCVKFVVNRFRGFGLLTHPKLPFPVDLLRRPYNSVALPCDTVMPVFSSVLLHCWLGDKGIRPVKTANVGLFHHPYLQ